MSNSRRVISVWSGLVLSGSVFRLCVCLCVWVCVLYVSGHTHSLHDSWSVLSLADLWQEVICRCKNINKQDRGWLWTGLGVKVGGACWLTAFSRSVSAVCLASVVNWPLKWLILATSKLPAPSAGSWRSRYWADQLLPSGGQRLYITHFTPQAFSIHWRHPDLWKVLMDWRFNCCLCDGPLKSEIMTMLNYLKYILHGFI